MALEFAKSDLPPDQQSLAEKAKRLDDELAALRAKFDQFLLGIERKNPQKEMEDYKRRLVKLKGEFIRNTSLKFRVQSLYQKFLSYERLWTKSLKEIEEGTYARDLFRLRRKQAQKEIKQVKEPKQQAEERPDQPEDLEADLPPELFGSPPPPQPPRGPLPRQKTDPALPSEVGGPPQAPVSRQPSKPPAPPPGSVAPGKPLGRQPSVPPPPPPGAVASPPRPTSGSYPAQPRPPSGRQPSAPQVNAQVSGGNSGNYPSVGASVGVGESGLSSDKVKRIYDAYLTAKKRCRENTDGLTLEAVEQSLRKQVPQLMKDHGAKSVDFKVVIKDGKAVLKAVPK